MMDANSSISIGIRILERYESIFSAMSLSSSSSSSTLVETNYRIDATAYATLACDASKK